MDMAGEERIRVDRLPDSQEDRNLIGKFNTAQGHAHQTELRIEHYVREGDGETVAQLREAVARHEAEAAALAPDLQRRGYNPS
jgi:hypothetical protein